MSRRPSSTRIIWVPVADDSVEDYVGAGDEGAKFWPDFIAFAASKRMLVQH
jgi:hypothetical protein